MMDNLIQEIRGAVAHGLIKQLNTMELSLEDEEIAAFFCTMVSDENGCSFLAKLISIKFSLEYDAVDSFLKDMYHEGEDVLKNKW